MKFKLTIYPLVDSAIEAYTTEEFETRCQLIAAKNACANLLLFLQSQLKAMDDESNMFILEEFIDGEWQWIELED